MRKSKEREFQTKGAVCAAGAGWAKGEKQEVRSQS